MISGSVPSWIVLRCTGSVQAFPPPEDEVRTQGNGFERASNVWAPDGTTGLVFYAGYDRDQGSLSTMDERVLALAVTESSRAT